MGSNLRQEAWERQEKESKRKGNKGKGYIRKKIISREREERKGKESEE